VDEYVVNVGDSSDRTLELVHSIRSGKIRIVEHAWDDRYTEKMRIYAVQTNLAMYECTGDWLVYLQADEVLHETDLPKISMAIQRHHGNRNVQGLLLDWLHFWGSYDYILDSYVHYRKEIRVFRNFLGVSSWRDAQGFRIDGKKLRVAESGARVFHYGWVLPSDQGMAKAANHSKYYNGAEGIGQVSAGGESRFFYNVDPYILKPFAGTHPAVMKDRIASSTIHFDIRECHVPMKGKHVKRRIQTFLERVFGLRLGEYRNYTLIRPRKENG
jgi:glycosyltransferase involved in cell wall biosynthesis